MYRSGIFVFKNDMEVIYTDGIFQATVMTKTYRGWRVFSWVKVLHECDEYTDMNERTLLNIPVTAPKMYSFQSELLGSSFYSTVIFALITTLHFSIISLTSYSSCTCDERKRYMTLCLKLGCFTRPELVRFKMIF